ncbi:MAG TPA: hypothetical protein VHG72_02640 [Polyangia bacterium]|nr:hypothetical protein [Polyangia bacterium]
MDLRDSDWTALEQRLEVVAASLRGLAATAAAGADNLEAAPVREAVAGAMHQLAEAVSLLLRASDPGRVARVPCRFCAQMIMPAATLCGFCWRKLVPAGGG